MTKGWTKFGMLAPVCIVAVLALLAGGSSAEMCGVDSTDPESMNCNAGMEGSAGMEGGTVYESLTVARVPLVSGLSYNFYDNSCPQYKTIIQQAVSQALQSNPLHAAGLTRIMFHDCFVQGCDASVLLTGANSEQVDTPNQTLRQESLQLINQIKSTLEQTCPNTVSCADVISEAAAEAIKQVNGPKVTMPMGRRDGTSMASANTVNNGLPSPFKNVSENMPIFTNLGLDYKDYVALSGAHTLGQAHCAVFSGRLNPLDANLDVKLASSLQQLCQSGNNAHSLDDTMNTFDNKYYKQVLSGDVLLQSDSSLDLDSHTSYLVKQYARSNSKFDSQFVRSFLKMSQLHVLTGSAGTIRKTCTVAN